MPRRGLVGHGRIPLGTLPMLIDELQVVKAVRWLRAKPTPRSRVHQLRLAATAGVGDRVTARMTVNSRRADGLGAAITARRGAGQITAELSQPRRADLITLLSVIVVCIALAGR
jgi:energy-coupling factor transport system permease protein